MDAQLLLLGSSAFFFETSAMRNNDLDTIDSRFPKLDENCFQYQALNVNRFLTQRKSVGDTGFGQSFKRRG